MIVDESNVHHGPQKLEAIVRVPAKGQPATSQSISFRPHLVEKIIANRKTQTRRVIFPQPNPNHPAQGLVIDPTCFRWELGGVLCDGFARNRYGAPGGTLWVRESYWERVKVEKLASKRLKFTPLNPPRYAYGDNPPAEDNGAEPVIIRAGMKQLPEEGWRRIPSIHMSKAASRLTLKIEDMRVERVQSISPSDVIAEGIQASYLVSDDEIVDKFRELWDSINGDRAGCKWEDNPYVLVIEFVVLQPEAEAEAEAEAETKEDKN